MKKQHHRFRLFPRSLQDVVRSATAPLMKKEGKLYTALLRDWVQIIGPERAAMLRPERIQFSRETPQESAVLHLEVRAANAPEMAYEEAQILESLARYFGYRAIGRLVFHASHNLMAGGEAPLPLAAPAPNRTVPALPETLPRDLKAVFTRMQKHVVADGDKQG